MYIHTYEYLNITWSVLLASHSQLIERIRNESLTQYTTRTNRENGQLKQSYSFY